MPAFLNLSKLVSAPNAAMAMVRRKVSSWLIQSTMLSGSNPRELNPITTRKRMANHGMLPASSPLSSCNVNFQSCIYHCMFLCYFKNPCQYDLLYIIYIQGASVAKTKEAEMPLSQLINIINIINKQTQWQETRKHHKRDKFFLQQIC